MNAQQFIACKYRYQAVKAYPLATVYKKVCGGYMVFDSAADYETWKNQK